MYTKNISWTVPGSNRWPPQCHCGALPCWANGPFYDKIYPRIEAKSMRKSLQEIRVFPMLPPYRFSEKWVLWRKHLGYLSTHLFVLFWCSSFFSWSRSSHVKIKQLKTIHRILYFLQAASVSINRSCHYLNKRVLQQDVIAEVSPQRISICSILRGRIW